MKISLKLISTKPPNTIILLKANVPESFRIFLKIFLIAKAFVLLIRQDFPYNIVMEKENRICF